MPRPLALLLGLCLLSSLLGAEEVAVGDPVSDLEFLNLIGGDGRTKIESFRGNPVLIAEFWGKSAGLKGVKEAFDLDDGFPDLDLVVILMETEEHDTTHLRALQMKEFPGRGGRLLPTQPLPFAYAAPAKTPRLALIGVDGRLLFADSVKKVKELKKILRKEEARLDEGWGEHDIAKRARAAAFGRHQWAPARMAVRAALKEEPGHAELEAVRQEIDARITAMMDSVDYYLEEGDPILIDVTLLAFRGMALIDDDLLDPVDELNERFKTPEVEREKELDGELRALWKSGAAKKPKPAQAKKMREFAELHPDSKVGARAKRIADAIDYLLNEL